MVTRPNYLKAMVWGRRPKSAKRRRRALRSWLAPTIVFISLLAIFTGLAFLNQSVRHIPAKFFLPQLFSSLLMTGFLLGALFCILIPFRLENRFSNARILQANCHDYRLAGFSGREMMTGLAAPQIRGMWLFSRVYLGMMVFLAGGLVIFAPKKSGASGLVFLVAGLMLPLMFNLIAGVFFHLTLWSRYPVRAQRLLALSAFIFSSPVTVGMIAFPITIFLLINVPMIVGIFIILEFFSVAVRAAIVGSAWSEARERLDGKREEIVRLMLDTPIDPEAESAAAAALAGEAGKD